MWWDDGKPPPGSFPYERIVNPVTGKTITDPIQYLALVDGCAYFMSDGRLLIDWFTLLDSRRAFRQIPFYVGLTKREIETFQKLREDVLVTHRFVARVFNISPPLALRMLFDAKIPVYLVGQQRLFFCGDLARWLEARRMEPEANGRLELRYYGRVWGKDQARQGNVQGATHAKRSIWSAAAARADAKRSRKGNRGRAVYAGAGSGNLDGQPGFKRKFRSESARDSWRRALKNHQAGEEGAADPGQPSAENHFASEDPDE